MGLNTEERQGVNYFVGTEVENTPLKGEKMLFIVGVQPYGEIEDLAREHNLKNLYFGTSQSFAPESADEWADWSNMINHFLKKGYWCTLDYDVFYAEEVLECAFDEYDNFINMISVKLPFISQYNYNATVKIDDTTWGHSNPGVWCHSLHSLMDRSAYTDWREYVGDTEV